MTVTQCCIFSILYSSLNTIICMWVKQQCMIYDVKHVYVRSEDLRRSGHEAAAAPAPPVKAPFAFKHQHSLRVELRPAVIKSNCHSLSSVLMDPPLSFSYIAISRVVITLYPSHTQYTLHLQQKPLLNALHTQDEIAAFTDVLLFSFLLQFVTRSIVLI